MRVGKRGFVGENRWCTGGSQIVEVYTFRVGCTFGRLGCVRIKPKTP